MCYISSDSEASLKALAKITSPLFRECDEALENFARTRVVSQMWVPGHSGLEDNKVNISSKSK